jgi:mono/diheme cytochrome c family protein
MSIVMTPKMLPWTALVLALGLMRPDAAAGQDAELVKKGQAVYAAQKCAVCHSIGGVGKKTSPLDGVGKKLSADELRDWILKPAEMTKKTKSTKKPVMPAKYSKLPAADVDALVAYMQSLK